MTTEPHSAVQQPNAARRVRVCVSLLIINRVCFVTSGTKQNNRAETPTTHTDISVYFTVSVAGKRKVPVSCFSQMEPDYEFLLLGRLLMTKVGQM